MRERPACLALLALVASSCVGGIGASSETPSPRPVDPGQGSMPGPGPMEPESPVGACKPGAVPWRGSLLTREQYINAVRDLLGFDVRALVSFADNGDRKAEPGVSLATLGVEERQKTAETIALAATAPDNLARLSCDPVTRGEQACGAALVQGLGTRAFRRPLAPETSAALTKLFEAGRAAGGFATGVEWLVAGLLQAPDFLYQLAPKPSGAAGTVVPLDDHALASRLAFFLWNSPPDEALLAAAGAGQLRAAAGVAEQVKRLLADPRAARMREDYYTSWLRLDQLTQVARDAGTFTAVAGTLKPSLLAEIHHLYEATPTAEALFGDPTLYVDANLAKAYGLVATGTALKPVAAPPDQRRGILTHPALLAVLARADASDPIARGVFIEEEVLCQTLPDPLPNIPDLPPLRPGLSTRQRLEQHRADPACAGCHQIIDPMGLALENYDSIGRYRITDQDVPVDSSAEITQDLDLKGKYANGMELLTRIPGSTTVRDCMAGRWFEYAVSREADPAERCELDSVRSRFRKSGDLGDLLVAITQTATFRSQLVEE
jgi:Protein of unknown function (DUF1588)/Protein of unknown function (DUF1592)/Protein of unknown function (DUF1595)/Protein of unknown function (DUF1585)/Protein of unknown function (DUF1587)